MSWKLYEKLTTWGMILWKNDNMKKLWHEKNDNIINDATFAYENLKLILVLGYRYPRIQNQYALVVGTGVVIAQLIPQQNIQQQKIQDKRSCDKRSIGTQYLWDI
jgi:hypothetical protein